MLYSLFNRKEDVPLFLLLPSGKEFLEKNIQQSETPSKGLFFNLKIRNQQTTCFCSQRSWSD